MSAKAKQKLAELRRQVLEVRIARVLLLIATGIAAYLTWISLQNVGAVGCGLNSDCHVVLQSRWSYWLGLPISTLGLVAYLGLLLASLKIFKATPAKPNDSSIALVLCIVITGGAVWFFLIQWLVLKRFCPYCLAAHACAVVGSLLIATNLSGRNISAPLLPRQRQKATLCGLVLVGLLVAGHWVMPRKEFSVQTAGNATAVVVDQPKGRMVELHQGLFKFLLQDYPIHGRPDAEHVLVSLFDYTCHYCRESHHVFGEALGRYSNQIAFLSLPMPLDASCNRLVKKTPEAHAHACDYARLALAVWRADRDAFFQFDQWLFAPNTPPSIEEAHQRAAQLVGSGRLQMDDPWIGQTITQAIALFEANARSVTNTQMPQLMIGKRIVLGPIKSLPDLERLFEQHLGPAKPAPRR